MTFCLFPNIDNYNEKIYFSCPLPSMTQNIYLGEQLNTASSILLHFLLRLYFLTFRTQTQQTAKDLIRASDKCNVTCNGVSPENFAAYDNTDEGKIEVSYQPYLIQRTTIQNYYCIPVVLKHSSCWRHQPPPENWGTGLGALDKISHVYWTVSTGGFSIGKDLEQRRGDEQVQIVMTLEPAGHLCPQSEVYVALWCFLPLVSSL